MLPESSPIPDAVQVPSRRGHPAPVTPLSPLGLAALRYARRGAAVFPCLPRDKKPATPHGYMDATRNPATVTDWWTRRPHANIGFVPASRGWVAMDHDSPASADLCARFGLSPDTTRAVRTAGGFHLYYRVPSDVEPPTDFLGVVFRFARGYVLLPPAVHPSGVIYTWHNRAEPAPLPSALADLWREIADEKTRGPRRVVGEGVGDHLAELADAVARWSSARATDYASWFRAGLLLYRLTNGSEDGFALFDQFSQRCPAKYDPRGVRRKWQSFATAGPGTDGLGLAITWARQDSGDRRGRAA